MNGKYIMVVGIGVFGISEGTTVLCRSKNFFHRPDTPLLQHMILWLAYRFNVQNVLNVILNTANNINNKNKTCKYNASQSHENKSTVTSQNTKCKKYT